MVHIIVEYKYKLARGTRDKPRGITRRVFMLCKPSFEITPEMFNGV
jgi:hypothetical protein